MDVTNIDPQVAALGIQLADISIRNTASAVIQKIETIKSKKKDKETIQELDEIINNLLADKTELIRIARAYEQEFVAQKITKEEIDYITTQFLPVVKGLMQQSTNDTAANMEKTIEVVEQLLSVEMITVLQVVGFNFKKAIGEPLTQLLQNLIASQAPIDKQSNLAATNLALMCNTEIVKAAQDTEASERLEQMRSEGMVLALGQT